MKSVHFSGVEIKAGQTWKRRDGVEVKIAENPGGISWRWRGVLESGAYSTYTAEGTYYYEGFFCMKDLESLVTTKIEVPIESESEPVPSYSVEEITTAFSDLGWKGLSLEVLLNKLKELQDPDYIEYLRLKNKFES